MIDPRPARLLGIDLEIDNLGEVSRLQGRAADQAAVDLGLSHEALNVGGLHAAAVLDADFLGGTLAVLARDGGAESRI